jgi:hypothetical protein
MAARWVEVIRFKSPLRSAIQPSPGHYSLTMLAGEILQTLLIVTQKVGRADKDLTDRSVVAAKIDKEFMADPVSEIVHLVVRLIDAEIDPVMTTVFKSRRSIDVQKRADQPDRMAQPSLWMDPGQSGGSTSTKQTHQKSLGLIVGVVCREDQHARSIFWIRQKGACNPVQKVVSTLPSDRLEIGLSSFCQPGHITSIQFEWQIVACGGQADKLFIRRRLLPTKKVVEMGHDNRAGIVLALVPATERIEQCHRIGPARDPHDHRRVIDRQLIETSVKTDLEPCHGSLSLLPPDLLKHIPVVSFN